MRLCGSGIEMNIEAAVALASHKPVRAIITRLEVTSS